MKLNIANVLIAFILVGCSSSSTLENNNRSAQDTMLVGTFVDAFVGGVDYATETQTGVAISTLNSVAMEG